MAPPLWMMQVDLSLYQQNQGCADKDDHFVITKPMLTLTDPGVKTRDEKAKRKKCKNSQNGCKLGIENETSCSVPHL